MFVPVFGSSALDKDDTTRNSYYKHEDEIVHYIYFYFLRKQHSTLDEEFLVLFFYFTMRRSFKERGKRLLNKISGDNTAAVAAGEISVATVLESTAECKSNALLHNSLTIGSKLFEVAFAESLIKHDFTKYLLFFKPYLDNYCDKIHLSKSYSGQKAILANKPFEIIFVG